MKTDATTENPYFDKFTTRFPEWALPSHHLTPKQEWQDLWDKWRWEYSHAVPTVTAINRIVKLGRPIVEMGASSGYWSWLLQRAGAAVTAYDSFIFLGEKEEFLDEKDERPPLLERDRYKPWTKVLKGGPSHLKNHHGHTVLICWPDHEPEMRMDADAVEMHSGVWLVYVGEVGASRHTGSDEFFNLVAGRYVLKAKIELPRWPGHEDAVFIYQRREESGA